MSAEAYRLKPWNEVVKPHDDIVSGKLEMATYAADLGAVDRDDPNTPHVYRDAREFFRATYPTRNLRKLLAQILGVIGGGSGDRVIQLWTPFGGGKTHALLALYHLMKSRSKIESQYLEGIPDPGAGRVAVLSGLDIDPFKPRVVDGTPIHTLWGELAWKLGGRDAFEQVRVHDEKGASPAGNVLRPIIGDRPVLLLLDEVLVYALRAGGRDGTHPLRRQVMAFLQGLTEVIRNLPNAAMVYSLQASVSEAAGEEVLLQELDHLVARVDAKQNPVSDDEVMRVVQRRLFPGFGEDPSHEQVAGEVASAYAIVYRRLREGLAETEGDKRAAQLEAERFEKRVVDSYPFHPELLDLMYHRWGSLPSYQRTRGALQFLASVVHALWGGARVSQPLIGPGDVPLEDERVRSAFFSQVGEREQYMAVMAADITGDEARAADVDRRIANDSPAFEQVRVGTRTATAVMLYSFGAREGEDRGVVETDLLPGLVSPDLDRNVVTTALHDLREELLYLHYTGRRYRFEPKANLNLLIAEEARKFRPEEVLDRSKAELARLLGPVRDRAVLWPPDAGAIPDGVPAFRVVYLGAEWVELPEDELITGVEGLVERRGQGKREYQNSLAFAVPGRTALERARSAARQLMGIESLKAAVKTKRVAIEKEQIQELEERGRGVGAELAGSLDRLYERILVPIADRSGAKPFALESVDLRAQLTAGRDLHERIIDGLRKHVFDSVTPARLVTLTRLGEEREFVATEDLMKYFFSYFDFPKVHDESAIRKGVARGTTEILGYVSAARVEDGTVVPSRKTLVWFGAEIPEGEVDLGPGCFILSPKVALELRGEPTTEPAPPTTAEPSAAERETANLGQEEVGPNVYRLRFAANAAQLFRAFPALQNLADKSSRFVAKIEVKAEGKEPFDKTWLRNAVEEHLDEAGVQADQPEEL